MLVRQGPNLANVRQNPAGHGQWSEAWPQTAGTMVKSRHATVPANRRPGLPRPDQDEKIRDRMMFEYMPSANLICA